MKPASSVPVAKMSTFQDASVAELLRMKPEEVDALSKDALKDAWVSRFAKEEATLMAVVEPASYQKLHQRALAAPRFVIPLMRDQGFVNFYSEYNGSKFLITPLERFQKEGAGAAPGLILHFYRDYQEKKQIVLMRGDVHRGSLSGDEAHILTSTLQIVHLDDAKYGLVKTFNHTPAKFSFDELLRVVKQDIYRTS